MNPTVPTTGRVTPVRGSPPTFVRGGLSASAPPNLGSQPRNQLGTWSCSRALGCTGSGSRTAGLGRAAAPLLSVLDGEFEFRPGPRVEGEAACEKIRAGKRAAKTGRPPACPPCQGEGPKASNKLYLNRFLQHRHHQRLSVSAEPATHLLITHKPGPGRFKFKQLPEPNGRQHDSDQTREQPETAERCRKIPSVAGKRRPALWEWTLRPKIIAPLPK